METELKNSIDALKDSIDQLQSTINNCFGKKLDSENSFAENLNELVSELKLIKEIKIKH